jgi:cytoskeletal protein CcmA (bactofilin family)
MFNKPARRGEKASGPTVASLLWADILIRGDIVGDGELHLDGGVQGDVRAARLVIGEHGRIEGHVTAETVEVRGTVIGSITARRINLLAGAHVEGELKHDDLTIEAGARFMGRSGALASGPAGEEPVLLSGPDEAA